MKKGFAFALAACLCLSAFGVACKEKERAELYAYMPDGAPALAFAYAMDRDEAGDGITYEVVNASTIESYVSYRDEEKNADICVLPVNTASKLLGTGERYQLLGTITHGNLYLLADNGASYTRENLVELTGKTVGVVQLANTPGITFKIILEDLKIPYVELTNDKAPQTDKVNLKGVAPDAVLPTEGIDAFVAPEPAASVKVSKTALDFAGSLQELYGGEQGFPQAVVVVKRSLLQKEPERVERLVEDLREGEKWLKTAEISNVCNAVKAHLTDGLTPSLTTATLSRTAIENASVWFSGAQACKAEINGFLEKMLAIGGVASLVEDEFFAK